VTTRPDGTLVTVLDEMQSLTAEIVDIAESVTDGWYPHPTRIDWENVWDRMDGIELTDGSELSIPALDTDAQREIKRQVRNHRKQM
jgi:hypothetical protein